MKSESLYDPTLLRSRWVAYFDLFGTMSLISSARYTEVFRSYDKAVKQIKRQHKSYGKLFRFWFSDTFIIFQKMTIGTHSPLSNP